jgi:hypothetical protein
MMDVKIKAYFYFFMGEIECATPQIGSLDMTYELSIFYEAKTSHWT